MTKTESVHGIWASRWVFIFAATGSAVGLGNIWKFPYIAGENGGGVFVLVYLACLALVGLPLLVAEVMIGRRARQSPANAIRALSIETAASPFWRHVGALGVVAGFLILSFYSVVAGWVLHYITVTSQGALVDIGQDQATRLFNQLLASPQTLFLWHSLFLILVMAIVAGGVVHGLERATRLLMPVLFALLLVLLGFSVASPSFGQAWNFLFVFDWSSFTWQGGLTALGHAFFTLSLGMGAIMAYGAYMPNKASIGSAAVMIALLDTLVALIAGLIIFPVVFASQMSPDAGPGLMFITLPVALGQIPGGQILGVMFFILVSLAALSSAISLMEPAVAWMIERMGIGRIKASLMVTSLAWLVGIGALASFNVLNDLQLFGLNIFNLLDFLTANLMLPLSGVLVAVFVGWKVHRYISEDELAFSNHRLFKVWYLLIRFVVPAAIGVIFYQNL